MKKSKLVKVLTVSLAALMVFGLASCGGGSGKVSDKDITVISREEGSGTRDAFTELTGVLPVSYTHLDVYKRQERGRKGSC